MRRSVPRPYLLERLWNKVVNFVLNLCLICTFLLIPVSLGFIVYHAFIQYSVEKVILFLIVLCVMIWSNIKMKGA